MAMLWESSSAPSLIFKSVQEHFTKYTVIWSAVNNSYMLRDALLKKLSVLGNIVLLLCMGKQKLWNSVRLEQQSIKQNEAFCGAELCVPENHKAIVGRRMKPPSSAFNFSALSTELSAYQQPHEGCWGVSSEAGI